MSDARLRALARIWGETGTNEDRCRYANELKRAGQKQQAAEHARAILLQNTHYQPARDLMKEANPCHWTGWVALSLDDKLEIHEPGKLIARINIPKVMAEEELINQRFDIPCPQGRLDPKLTNRKIFVTLDARTIMGSVAKTYQAQHNKEPSTEILDETYTDRGYFKKLFIEDQQAYRQVDRGTFIREDDEEHPWCAFSFMGGEIPQRTRCALRINRVDKPSELGSCYSIDDKKVLQEVTITELDSLLKKYQSEITWREECPAILRSRAQALRIPSDFTATPA